MESANNGMCRCCASEGTFKDVKTKYLWMGEEEIYSDMLKECFDITLFTSESGCNGGICEVCITQLRNAANFKRQVLHTEEQFKKRLQGKTLFKSDIVKMEMTNSIDDDGDSDNNFSEDFSTADYEIPIKEEIPVEMKPKKRAAKATTSKTKKPKVEDGESSTTRAPVKSFIKIEKTVSKPVASSRTKLIWVNKLKNNDETETKQNMNYGGELGKSRHNIRMILQNSNATPIRCHGGIGYACCFCTKQFPKPADLKTHTMEQHDDETKHNFMKGKMMFSYLVKLDITGLQCSICNSAFDKLDPLVDHLIKSHAKTFFKDVKNYIFSFKFDSDVLRCIYCSNIFNTFKTLQEHMNVHYRNFICEVCKAGFVNRHVLSNHSEGHKLGVFNCQYCTKVFDTLRKKKTHEKSIHIYSQLLNKCRFCNQKFKDYRRKNYHMAQVHGVVKELKCQACDKTFVNHNALTTHTKRDHLMERRHKCHECDMTFYSSNELRDHAVKHSGLRQFQCGVCLKSYGRKKTLREHMRIHIDDRRFKCEHCGQAFVQKCSWRGHMRSKHGKMV